MIRWNLLRLALPALLLLATPAFAAEGGHDADAAHGAKPALLDWDIGTAFWSILVFVVVLVILRMAAWKPILQGLHQRERFITESIESARRERLEADRLLADYQARINKAREEATAIVEEGKRDAEAVRKRIHDEAHAEAEAMKTRARREIEIARDDALKSLYEQSVGLASIMAGRIVRRELTPGDHQRLIEESLNEMSEAAR